MSDTTLPNDVTERSSDALTDHLYLALAGGRAGGGARWSLDGVDTIEIGRGSELAATWRGRALHLELDDAYLSREHLRLARQGGTWTAIDAGSRNGITVNGVLQRQVVLHESDLIEAGRSFFFLRPGELAGPRQLVLPARQAPGALATLDPYLARAIAELERLAPSRTPVLIGGATGTGKERIAQTVHRASGRRGDYVPVNCGALPAGLVESELFGHKKGAFSGAVADSAGLIAASSGGTLFLDELGDLPLPAQATMLRVLEQGEVRAVGATAATRVDLRVVAATHRDLEAMVEARTFREDLLARLAGFRLELPPLCERRCDLGAILGETFGGLTFSAGAARALFAYAWPRNVRELTRAVERAAALSGGGELRTSHLPEEVATAKLATAPATADARREELVALLQKHQGNVSRVAAELGRLRQQVQRWLKRYAIDPARFR